MTLSAYKTYPQNHAVSWTVFPSNSNGKEKDWESGFHYYGARYYWSEVLTGWLSVDPMADKYPFISSYNYCAENPVKIVDPDGRKIVFAKGTTLAQKRQFYAAVRHLDSHNCGGRYGQIKNSKREYTISFVDNYKDGPSFNKDTRTITWCPSAGLETDQGHVLSPATILNHEMAHATHYDDAMNKYEDNYYHHSPEKANEEYQKYTSTLTDDISNPYGSVEEQSVITGVEQRTAKSLGEIKEGEVTRNNHRGTLIKVDGPTSTNKTSDL